MQEDRDLRELQYLVIRRGAGKGVPAPYEVAYVIG